MNDLSLQKAAERLAGELQRTGKRIVFAESCTGGLISATLARIPGISNHLCGSAVVYRDVTKFAWLGVSAEDLADESIGPVSEPVAAAMAGGVLERTEEADLAASVTGHLGPDAPDALDGVIYVGIAARQHDGSVQVEHVRRQDLKGPRDAMLASRDLRSDRQHRATAYVLELTAELLAGSD